jgi:hypothetical protein
MKRRRVAKWLWLLALGAVLAGVSGCETNDPDNVSVRPWNAPQGSQGGALDGMNYQHE